MQNYFTVRCPVLKQTSHCMTTSRRTLHSGLVTKLQESGSSAADFLSSLEVVIVDHADVIMMQNWQHVQTLFQNCNNVPKETHGTDVMRVHESHLNGLAKHLRQTVVLSSFPSAEINALTRNECLNAAGRVRWRESFPGMLGRAAKAVQNVGGLRQQFERLPDCAVAVRLRSWNRGGRSGRHEWKRRSCMKTAREK